MSESALGLLVKATLVLVAVFITVVVLRRQSAAVRHFAWAVGFLGLALLPLLAPLFWKRPPPP